MMLEGSWVLGYNDDIQLQFIHKSPLIHHICFLLLLSLLRRVGELHTPKNFKVFFI